MWLNFLQLKAIRFFHRSHNTVHFLEGRGVFALKQWIISSLKHDTVPRVNNLYCFYVKNPPKRVALWGRENSQLLGDAPNFQIPRVAQIIGRIANIKVPISLKIMLGYLFSVDVICFSKLTIPSRTVRFNVPLHIFKSNEGYCIYIFSVVQIFAYYPNHMDHHRNLFWVGLCHCAERLG